MIAVVVERIGWLLGDYTVHGCEYCLDGVNKLRRMPNTLDTDSTSVVMRRKIAALYFHINFVRLHSVSLIYGTKTPR